MSSSNSAAIVVRDVSKDFFISRGLTVRALEDDAPGDEFGRRGGLRRTTSSSHAVRWGYVAKWGSIKTDPDRSRFSVRKKTDAVMRLLRGEDVDKISRDLRVTAATLTRWREDFIAGGRIKLKSRPVVDGQDETLLRLSSPHIGGSKPCFSGWRLNGAPRLHHAGVSQAPGCAAPTPQRRLF